MTKVKTPIKETVVARATASSSFESAFEHIRDCRRRGERSRAFPHIIAAPIHYEPNYAYPLLVWLHDSDQNEREVCDVAARISTQNYVAAAPRGVARIKRRVVRSRVAGTLVDEKSWNEAYCDWPETEAGVSEAEDLVFASIDEAIGKFNINPRRIFLLGRGVGGTMAMRVGLRNPREFAGVVSIDGGFPSLDNIPFLNWQTARDLPILMTTGGNRSTNMSPVAAKRLRLFHTAGMTVAIRQYNETSKGRKATEARMNKIFSDVNVWVMERALNPQAPISELFGRS